MKQLITLCSLAFLFGACQKKELPAPAFDRGDVITNEVDMGSTYKEQIWYSLSSNRIISSNHKTDWDLAFETSATGNHIYLNGSKAMKTYKTAFTDLSAVNDTTGLEVYSKADAPSGNSDSTAFEDIQANSVVYIINRGFSETGAVLGFYKLKMTSLSATQFVFEYGDIFGTQISQATVNKDEDYNFVMFSFNTNQQLVIEPKKTEYDICFTGYTHIFLHPFQYYQVTGVLQNQYRTRTILIKDRPFADIGINDTLGRQFSAFRNAIGYEWKTFNLNTNLYAVDPSYCYIINDHNGFFYKLHFIDFYNSSGIKGVPKFEFKKL